MNSANIIITPPQHCDPSLAIAAVRAGEIGLLDLGTRQTTARRKGAIERLIRYAGDRRRWGLRWELRGADALTPSELIHGLIERIPYLLIAGHSGSAEAKRLQPLLKKGRELADTVLLEVIDPETAQAASELGFDGVVIRASEAGGRSSEQSMFEWLQLLPGTLERPFWIQGAWGPDTAAAAHLVGAAGIVLGEELWLARESSLPADERRASEMPEAGVGQGISLAGELARRWLTVGGILAHYRSSVLLSLSSLPDCRPLAPGNRLAQACGTRYPVFQQATMTDEITSFEQVHSQETLAQRLGQGIRRFVLEGAWPNLITWQKVIDCLLDTDVRGREKILILFSAGIRDAQSSALIQAMLARLAGSGIGVGLLLEGASGPDAAVYEDLCVAGTERAVALAGRTLPEQVAPAVHVRPEPIAIVGMACRFARSPDLRSYWATIIDQVEAIEDVSSERWDPDLYYSADLTARDKVYSIRGGFLEDATFDPLKYGIPPASLRSIEPMQLLALEVASDALADSGYDKRTFDRDHTGVFFGIDGVNDLSMGYSMRAMLPHYLAKVQGVDRETLDAFREKLNDILPEWTEDSFPGYLFNLLSGRVASKLDLHGANFTVDAACASSLAAVQVALDQLRQGSCQMAIVGAADGSNHPFGFMSFAKTHALSPGGRARPFDERADGIVLGEGVAAIVLKPLSQAERDGDRIYSLICGIGASSDGRSRSLTAPHAPTQALALRRAYNDAGIDPSTVSLIEAHATGTAVGDRSEIDALTQVFGGPDQQGPGCAIGSVKANVGHTKSVAGLAGMIKTSLALKHRVLPPTINVDTPNTGLENSPFYVNTDSRPWMSRAEGEPRRSGVSAFGFGGTNFHLILEEYQGDYHATDQLDFAPRPAEMFYWRGEGSHALGQQLTTLRDELRQTPGVNLAQLAYGIQLQSCAAQEPSGSEHRLGLMASSPTDLIEKLDRALQVLETGREGMPAPGIVVSSAAKLDPSEVCFLFPGQGSQRLDMLIDLVRDWPEGLAFTEQTDRLLADLLPRPLSSYIYPTPTFDEQARERHRLALDDTRYTQPALGLMDLLAFKVLKHHGLEPAFSAGHSFGEIVALCAAGAISEPDLLRLSARRGQAVFDAGQLNPGRMAAVSADADVTAAALSELGLSVQIANLNAPQQTIVAGPEGAVEEAIAKLRTRGLTVRRVPVTAAFHTPAMEAPLQQVSLLLQELDLCQTAFPVYSNVTAAAYPTEVEAIRAQLASHLARPVQFVEQIRAMYRDGAKVFIEAGPGRLLTGLVERILEGEDCHALAIDSPGQPGRLSLGDLLVRLSVLGLPVDRNPWFVNRLLTPQPPLDCLRQTRQDHAGRPTDWIVGPRGSHPLTEPAPVTPPETPATASSILSAPPVGNQVKEISALTKKQQPSNSPLLDQLQSSMNKWLDLQCQNQRLNERFLDIQERIVAALLNGDVSQASGIQAGVPGTTRQGTSEAPTSQPEGLAVAPAPILPDLRPTIPNAMESMTSAAIPSPQSETAATPAVEPLPATDGDHGEQSVEIFKRDLLTEVSRRTGYPEDILDLDLALEAGLGIDSIKTMEIFSALKRYHHVFADEDADEEESLVQFTQLKTLRDIIEFYGARIELIDAGQEMGDVATPEQAQPTAPEPATAVDEVDVRNVERLVLKPVAAPPQELDLTTELGTFPRDQIMLLLGDAPELAAATEAALTSSGLRVIRVIHGSETRKVGPQKYEVDLSDLASVKRLAFWITENEEAQVGGLINLLTLSHTMRNRELNGHHEPLQLVQWLMNVVNVFEDQIRAASLSGGGRLVNITTLDGRFGLRSATALPIAQAGTLGFFKSLAHEWPGVRVKNIDLDPDADPQTLVIGLLREIAAWDDLVEVGLDGEGRWSLELVPDKSPAVDPAELLATLPLDKKGVVLVTGGARGITAEVAKRMAGQTGAHFIIVGRSTLTSLEDEQADIRSITDEGDLRNVLIAQRRRDNAEMIPAEIERDLQRIQKDRAVRENLECMQASGATVEYHSLDVRNNDEFAALIDDIYQRFGRIDGVLHGAGVIEDGWLRNKHADSFARVFETKVNSALLMAHRLRPEDLRFMVFFSSVSGRFGNLGQVDYAAANECLNKLADHLDHAWPGRVVSINWGPWDAGMLSDGLRQAYQERGIELIPIKQGVEALLDELCRQSSQVPEVVLTCSPHEFSPIV